MTDRRTDSGISEGSATTTSPSTTTSASGVATSVSLPSVFNNVISELENLDLNLNLNITKMQARSRQNYNFKRSCHFKSRCNERCSSNSIPKFPPLGYEDDMRMIKENMLTYFRDLGGNPNTIRQDKIARRQLDELCHIYYLSKYTNNTYGYTMNALVSMILAHSYGNINSSDIPIPTITFPGSHAIYYGTCNIPIPENPEYNLIGRILGPRGMSACELESRFRCRVFVRGRGSIRNPEKAEFLMNKSGWEHLTDPLHVHIQVQGFSKQEVESRIVEIQSFIDRLLHPQGFDAFKRRQLISLAFMNGTFRPPPQLKHFHFNQAAAPSEFKCRDLNAHKVN